jgi:putative membrane protein
MDLTLLAVVACVSLLGAGLGSLTGLAPGLHVNTLALLLVASAPVVLPGLGDLLTIAGTARDAAPLLMVVLIVAAAVAHSILDFLPSIFLGAPEEETALGTLPGHRMLLQGKGLEAVRCSAYGGLVGVTAAVALCLPLSMVLGSPLDLYPVLDLLTPLVVIVAMLALLWSQRGPGMTVCLVVRRVVPSSGVLSLVRPVPVDGQEGTVTGIVERDLWGRRWLCTPPGRWRLRGDRLPPGSFQVEGHWRVRKASGRERSIAIVLLILSGLLGFTCMEARLPTSEVWEGMGQSVLFPLLTGLFGTPALIVSLRRGAMPEQESKGQADGDLACGLKGALSGALVGWFPGISATTGVIIASALPRGDQGGPRGYLTMVSAVGTSSTVLGLLALVIAFKGRSGAMLAAKAALGPDGASLVSPPSPWFPLLLLAALLSAAVSYHLALLLGTRIANLAAGADLRPLNRAVVVLLIVMVVLFCGIPGLAVLGTATLLGLLPPRLGVSRVHLTGCLLLPTALHFLGLKAALLAML